LGNFVKKQNILNSDVEKNALSNSERELRYGPTEKIGVIEVDNFPALGKLTALRFLEWVQENRGGVVSLPTGKTPEHFIKWVSFYLSQWSQKTTQQDLEEGGINPSIKPDIKSLTFVQIDEFYPINPTQMNSFNYYINKYYFGEFGLDRQKALMMNAWTTGVPEGRTLDQVFPDEIVDLSLRTRYGKNKLERLQKSVIDNVDQYCTEYETKIRDLGGIGFFLGGIGPDGHIGFNVRGSDHYSTTRLTATNYETQAAAAGDLGGIEVARNRLVITIGLSTITFNPYVVALVSAAGEAKAQIIKNAIEHSPSNMYPATVLQKLKNARFYLTKGAASKLIERNYQDLIKKDEISQADKELFVIDLALENRKRIGELTSSDLKSEKFSNYILKQSSANAKEICSSVDSGLSNKLERGLSSIDNKVFLHTAPHHDDIMLGYWAYIIHLVRSPQNFHHFNYLTSGFNAVTNTFCLNQLKVLIRHIETPLFQKLMSENYFDPNNDLGRNRDMYQYLDGVAAHSSSMQREGEARRMLRNLVFLFEETSLEQLKNRANELLQYFNTQYPGKKDLPYIQQLKGMIREWEADLLWGYLGFNSSNVNHLRLGFYKGDIFTEEPNIERDVTPVLKLLRTLNPDIVTVALDPEGSGPDTHYKVQQVIYEALKLWQKESGRDDIEVWGYRNVWFRFHPADADVLIPVSLNSMAVLDNAFEKCFVSQKDASFPSYEMDGPFSRLSQSIMVEQYNNVKICLGRKYFNENKHPRVRASHGLVYLKKMDLEEFFDRSYQIRKSTESLENGELF
jgi:glucosamine-6-phosphate deaminase